jgi:DNA-binding LacI/PurR family transcriptional regulator
MAITIKDIARKAGVSHTTVSRALLGNPLISLDTTERIRRLAAEMGYRPSAAARSLKTNRSQALGVIVSNIDDPYFSEVLQGIESTAQQRGYSLFIAASQHDPEREDAIVQAMVEHRVEGVIVCSSSFGAERGHRFVQYGVPIVAVNNQAVEDYRYSIYHDDVDGSRQLTAHLIGIGHKRIGYLGNALAGRTNLDRLAGYRQELQAAHLELPGQYIHDARYGEAGAINAAAQHFLRLPEPPTALVCYNDMMAIELLQSLQRAGRLVPRDLSVTGFDNIVFSAYTAPALTTFDQPKRYIGEEAGRLLLSLLEVRQEPQVEMNGNVRVLRGRLLVRGSTAAPRGSM